MATANTTTKFTAIIDGKETVITNIMMLEAAIKAFEQAGFDPAYIGKAKQHMATLKKSSVNQTVSNTALKNAADAETLKKILTKNEPFTLELVADKMGYINTSGKANTQKAYQVVKILLDAQEVMKVATKSSESAKYQLIQFGVGRKPSPEKQKKF